MDIAAFKVSHCIGSDIDATSLQAEKARSASMGLWRNYHRRFEMQTLTYCDAEVTSTRTTVSQFKGAMDESSGNVQSANSYSILRTCKAALRQFSGAMEELSGKVQKASAG